MGDNQEDKLSADYRENSNGPNDSVSPPLGPTSLVRPAIRMEDDLLTTINDHLNSNSIKEATELVELYRKAYEIVESKKAAEFERQIELRKQQTTERANQFKHQLEERRQREIEKQNQQKNQLELRKQQEDELVRRHKRALELREFEYRWAFTILSFMVGILLIIIGFGTSGGIIVGGSLSIPAAGFVKNKIQEMRKGKEGEQ